MYVFRIIGGVNGPVCGDDRGDLVWGGGVDDAARCVLHRVVGEDGVEFVFEVMRCGEFFAEKDGIGWLFAMVEGGEDDIFVLSLLFFGEGGDNLEGVVDVFFVICGLEDLLGCFGGEGLFAAFIGAEGVFETERVLRGGDFDEHLVCSCWLRLPRLAGKPRND